MNRLPPLVAVLLAMALPTTAPADDQPQKETIQVAGVERAYVLFVPDSATRAATAPLLVLFHGSYSNGLSMIQTWAALASQEGLVLVAPDALDNRWWRIREDGPAFVRAVVDAVAAKQPIDARRVYLFGHSGGAVYVLTLAMLESEYFAAAAVHAGAWIDPKSFIVLPHATRKIPVNLYVGDRDQFFPLKPVRKTDTALRRAGHPGSLTIIKRHDHAYSKVAAEVNRNVWDFMRGIALDTAPKFQSYD